MQKSIIAFKGTFLSVVFCCVALFFGCDNSNEPKSVESEETTETSAVPDFDVTANPVNVE